MSGSLKHGAGWCSLPLEKIVHNRRANVFCEMLPLSCTAHTADYHGRPQDFSPGGSTFS